MKYSRFFKSKTFYNSSMSYLNFNNSNSNTFFMKQIMMNSLFHNILVKTLNKFSLGNQNHRALASLNTKNLDESKDKDELVLGTESTILQIIKSFSNSALAKGLSLLKGKLILNTRQDLSPSRLSTQNAVVHTCIKITGQTVN